MSVKFTARELELISIMRNESLRVIDRWNAMMELEQQSSMDAAESHTDEYMEREIECWLWEEDRPVIVLPTKASKV